MADTKLEKYTYAIGRRKTATATVRLFLGKGVSTVNNKPVNEMFPSKIDQRKIASPFKAIGKETDFYFTAVTNGGGTTGQSGAVRHALSRALAELNPDYRLALKPLGYLTRDPRMVERKKTGLRKARKSEQYSKR